ncbi:glycosyltransferase [Crocinitomicaceae bacterium]|nr:glycosyltransferase [Crocinitomicaceae bacterium]
MNPFYSVVLPTFNRSDFITGAINSLLNQTFDDWELIIVDDGSTDNTKEVVEQYSKKDPRIKYVYQKNSERSAARNNGIDKAKGNFVCFLDSDDEYDKNHLKILYDEIHNSVEKSNHFFITNAQIKSKDRKKKLKNKVIVRSNSLETILLNSITPGQLCIPSKLIKENLFNTDIRISEDTDLLIRLAKNNTYKILPYHTHIYIEHEYNSVNPVKFNAYKERLNTLKYILKMDVCKGINKKLKRKILSDCYFGISKYYYAQNRILKSKLILLKALLIYPEIRLKEKLYLIIKNNKIQ